MLRKLSHLTILMAIWSPTCTTAGFDCWDRSPFAASNSSDLIGALLDSLHTPDSDLSFLHQLDPRFPITESQMSCSFK